MDKQTPAGMYLERRCSMDDMCACISELSDEVWRQNLIQTLVDTDYLPPRPHRG